MFCFLRILHLIWFSFHLLPPHFSDNSIKASNNFGSIFWYHIWHDAKDDPIFAILYIDKITVTGTFCKYKTVVALMW